MPAIPSLSENCIESLAKIIARHECGLTHSQIAEHLKRNNIDDCSADENKERRLTKALLHAQKTHNCANNVLAFLRTVADPQRFVGRREQFESFRAELNKSLVFASLMLKETGDLVMVEAARTLDEAEEKASSLRKKLDDRKVHRDVIKCCKTELIRDNNYFHTVLEASKSVFAKIRLLTERTEDGNALIDLTLLPTTGNLYPMLAINKFGSESEKSEQKGFANLAKGLCSMFRNPTAHDPKSLREVTEDEALEFLVIASLLHRKLDQAHLTGAKPQK